MSEHKITLVLNLDAEALDYLEEHACKRNVTMTKMSTRLLEIVFKERMIDAVLDDGGRMKRTKHDKGFRRSRFGRKDRIPTMGKTPLPQDIIEVPDFNNFLGCQGDGDGI